jgi:CheY-like chemotaxis protein
MSNGLEQTDQMQIDLLLADGQATARQLLAGALRSLPDVRVCEVGTGREAVTSLARATFSAVVCGMQLPDLRWSQLQGLIRSGACGFPNTPLLVLTDMPALLASATAKNDPYTSFLNGDDPADLADRLVHMITHRPRHSVLLVEDEEQYARFCADLIKPFYEVEIRSEGRSALAAWRARQHHVIVLDLMLPGTSGEELLEVIKREKPSQPVLILTSNDGPEKHQEMVLSGAAEFLSKGSAATLASAIDRVLRDEQSHALAASLHDESERHRSVISRLHAAHYSLERGQASNATRHLIEALEICPVRGPTDDEWAQMLEENEERGATPRGVE